MYKSWQKFWGAMGVAMWEMHSSIAHNIICTRLFHGKMHSGWFNGTEILQGRWQHGEKVGYCYPSRLEKILCKWDSPAGHERVKLKPPQEKMAIHKTLHKPSSLLR